MNSSRRSTALLALSLLAACSGDRAPAAERVARAEGNGDVVVGVAWPWEARADVLYEEGLELALEEINGEGGVLGRAVRLVKADDREDIEEGRRIAQAFGDDPDVVAAIGHLQSYVTVPAAAIYDLSGLLLVAPASTSSELTRHGYSRVFRTIFSDRDVGRGMASYALRRGHRRMAVYYARDVYGRSLANAFEEHFVRKHGDVVDRRSYDPNVSPSPRRAGEIAELWGDLDPDGIFIAGQPEAAAVLVTELRDRGVDAPVLGGDAVGTPTYVRRGGDAVEGTVIATAFHARAPVPEVRRFTAAFRDRYGTAPDVAAALGYDALRVLVHAMRSAGSVIPYEVATALREVRGWPGVTGAFSFDESGNRVDMPIRLSIVRGGSFRYLGVLGTRDGDVLSGRP